MARIFEVPAEIHSASFEIGLRPWPDAEELIRALELEKHRVTDEAKTVLRRMDIVKEPTIVCAAIVKPHMLGLSGRNMLRSNIYGAFASFGLKQCHPQLAAECRLVREGSCTYEGVRFAMSPIEIYPGLPMLFECRMEYIGNGTILDVYAGGSTVGFSKEGRWMVELSP